MSKTIDEKSRNAAAKVKSVLDVVSNGKLGITEAIKQVETDMDLSGSEREIVVSTMRAMVDKMSLRELGAQHAIQKAIQMESKIADAKTAFQEAIAKLEALFFNKDNLSDDQTKRSNYKNMQIFVLQLLLEQPTTANIDLYLSKFATDKDLLFSESEIYMTWSLDNLGSLSRWIYILCGKQNDMGIEYAKRVVDNILHNGIARQVEFESDAKARAARVQTLVVAAADLVAILIYGQKAQSKHTQSLVTKELTSTLPTETFSSASTGRNRYVWQIYEHMLCTAFRCSSFDIAQMAFMLLNQVIGHGDIVATWKTIKIIALESSELHKCLASQRGVDRFSRCLYLESVDQETKATLYTEIASHYRWRALSDSFLFAFESGVFDPVQFATNIVETISSLADTDELTFVARPLLRNYMIMCTSLDTNFAEKFKPFKAKIIDKKCKQSIERLFSFIGNGEMSTKQSQDHWSKHSF